MEKRYNITKIEKYQKELKARETESTIEALGTGIMAIAAVASMLKLNNTDNELSGYILSVIFGSISFIGLKSMIYSILRIVNLENKIEEEKNNMSR